MKMFDATTGSQLTAESQVFNCEYFGNIVATADGRVIATITVDPGSVSLLDTSTLTQIGPDFRGDVNSRIWSLALSWDGGHLATGGFDGENVVRDVRNIRLDPVIAFCHFVAGANLTNIFIIAYTS